MSRETHYGSIYTNRVDATGYTRFAVEAEWVVFETPIPAGRHEAAGGRLFRFYDREAVR